MWSTVWPQLFADLHWLLRGQPLQHCWGTRSGLVGGAWTGNGAYTAVSARASGDQIHLPHLLLPTWGLCIIRSSLPCCPLPTHPSWDNANWEVSFRSSRQEVGRKPLLLSGYSQATWDFHSLPYTEDQGTGDIPGSDSVSSSFHPPCYKKPNYIHGIKVISTIFTLSDFLSLGMAIRYKWKLLGKFLKSYCCQEKEEKKPL